jgi:hypothetical protein
MTEPLPWTYIYDRVKSQIPAAPDALIRQQAYLVMLDISQDVNIWTEEVPITIQPNVMTYPFTVTNGRTNRLMIVYNNDLTSIYAGQKYRWADNGITMRVPGVLELFINPSQTKNWIAVVAKAVSNPRLDTSVTPPVSTGYPEIDNWIVEQYNDMIYYGMMHFLQRMPSKPFGNATGSADNGAQYLSQKAQARSAVMRSNVYNAQDWIYPQGFATVTRKGWA